MTDAEMRRLALEHAGKTSFAGEPFAEVQERIDRILTFLRGSDQAKAPITLRPVVTQGERA